MRTRNHVLCLAATLTVSGTLMTMILNHPGGSLSPGKIGSRPGDFDPAEFILDSGFPSLLSLSADGPAPGTTESAAALAEGRRLYTEGAVAESSQVLEAGLAAHPDDYALLVAAGASAFAAGRYSAAEEYLQRGLLVYRSQKCGEVPTLLGLAQLRQKKYGPALKTLGRALRRTPRDGDLHMVLAAVHARLEDRDHALHHVARAYHHMGSGVLLHISDPSLDAVRDTPEFREIVKAALADRRAAGAAAGNAVPK